MKKIIILLTGIVFLITILVAGGCKSATDRKAEKVEIYLSSVKVDGVEHLKMRDSNGNSAIDSLITDVKPGVKVFWRLDSLSGIKKILGIYSRGERNIFKKDPGRVFLGKSFKLKLSDDIKGDEKYAVEYRLEDKTEQSIDPYLRVPPPGSGTGGN
jgi:hypothetical protein